MLGVILAGDALELPEPLVSAVLAPHLLEVPGLEGALVPVLDDLLAVNKRLHFDRVLVQAAERLALQPGLVPLDRPHHVRRQLLCVYTFLLLHFGELLPALHDLQHQLKIVLLRGLRRLVLLYNSGLWFLLWKLIEAAYFNRVLPVLRRLLGRLLHLKLREIDHLLDDLLVSVVQIPFQLFAGLRDHALDVLALAVSDGQHALTLQRLHLLADVVQAAGVIGLNRGRHACLQSTDRAPRLVEVQQDPSHERPGCLLLAHSDVFCGKHI